MAKAKTGRQVIAATKRAIDSRISGGGGARAGATKTALRQTLQHSLHPAILTHALEIAGLHMNTATADQLHDLNYGISWARAHNRTLQEYFSTPWGQDLGAETADQPQLPIAA